MFVRMPVSLQYLLLQTALDIHGKKAPENLQPFHAHLTDRFGQMKKMLEKDCHFKVGLLDPGNW